MFAMPALAVRTNVTNRFETPSQAVAGFVHYCQELLTDLITKLDSVHVFGEDMVLLDLNLNMGDGMIADSLMQADVRAPPTTSTLRQPSVVRLVNAFLVLIKRQFTEQCPKFAEESGTSQPPVLTINLKLGKNAHFGLKAVYDEPMATSMVTVEPVDPESEAMNPEHGAPHHGNHVVADSVEGHSDGSQGVRGAGRPRGRPRAASFNQHVLRAPRELPVAFGPIRRGDAEDFFLSLRRAQPM